MSTIQILMIAEIVVAVLMTITIILQPKESDAGTMFGGGFGEEVKRTKRGAELFLHNATIVLGVVFVALAIAIMLLNR